ncbi:deaminase [Candidatus Falkowbacteria bacterium]|nr:deaminase [Candidatus Falkowbacteria bacterium]
MKKERPITTLFMLSSLDGKISTGDTDKMDVDSDYRKIKGVKEGLQQYYEIEKTTDMHFLITGKVMAKKCESLDVNNRKDNPAKISINCIIVDSKNLSRHGVEYLLKKFNSLTVVTANREHPAFQLTQKDSKLAVIYYSKKINFINLFNKLKDDYGIKRLTIQSGSTINAELLRKGLVDHVSLVIAPCLIGGKDKSSLVGGESFHGPKELSGIKSLKLKECNVLKNSYLHLKYDVMN